MPTVDEMWAKKNAYTRTASEISRTLSLAGFAVIWIFRDPGPGNGFTLAAALLWAAAILVLALVLDLTQYSAGAWLTGRVAQRIESEINAKGLGRTHMFQYPSEHPRLMNALWTAKVICVVIAWALLVMFVFLRAISAGLPGCSP